MTDQWYRVRQRKSARATSLTILTYISKFYTKIYVVSLKHNINLLPRGRDPFGQRQGLFAGQSNADSGNEIDTKIKPDLFLIFCRNITDPTGEEWSFIWSLQMSSDYSRNSNFLYSSRRRLPRFLPSIFCQLFSGIFIIIYCSMFKLNKEAISLRIKVSAPPGLSMSREQLHTRFIVWPVVTIRVLALCIFKCSSSSFWKQQYHDNDFNSIPPRFPAVTIATAKIGNHCGL